MHRRVCAHIFRLFPQLVGNSFPFVRCRCESETCGHLLRRTPTDIADTAVSAPALHLVSGTVLDNDVRKLDR